jgi:hypothetical protein
MTRGRVGVAALLALAALAFAVFAHLRGVSVARASRDLRESTWMAHRDQVLGSGRDMRSESRLARIEGAVLDDRDAAVEGATVIVVDLDLMRSSARDLTLQSVIPAEAIEATVKSRPDGTYFVSPVRLGPKAVFASLADKRSPSRWVCRVIDGLPVRAFDLRLASPEQIGMTIQGALPGRPLSMAPILDELWPSSPGASPSGSGPSSIVVPPGARPSWVLLRDEQSKIAKALPVDYLSETTAAVRAEARLAEVPIQGLPDGDYHCEVDDLDLSVASISAGSVSVRSGVAVIPLLGGSCRLVLRSQVGATLIALRSGSSPEVEARLGDSPQTASIDLSELLKDDEVASADVLPENWSAGNGEFPTMGQEAGCADRSSVRSRSQRR